MSDLDKLVAPAPMSNTVRARMKNATGGAFGAGLALVVLPSAALIMFVATLEKHSMVGLPILAIFGIMILFGALALISTVFARLDLSAPAEALALPPGSIRAAIALALIVLFALISVMLYQSLSQPYVIEHFPALDPGASFPVRVLAAERTFWEKACLLHEETFRPADKPRKLRMARHYYDLWCLLQAGVGTAAITNKTLFRRVAEHREIFFRYSWVDYSTHKAGTFRLSPMTDQVADWRADYREMLGPMFFGETPTFEQLMAAAAKFEKVFNATA